VKLTIAYTTARPEPRVNWLCEAVAAQRSESDELELVVVDLLGPRPLPNNGAPFDHALLVHPKPTIWQGSHRVTACDFWAMSSARNTAIVYAHHDYVAFVDDRCRPGPGWLAAIRRGERERSCVVVGPYDKHEDVGGEPQVSIDHRTIMAKKIGRPAGVGAAPERIACGGSWLFGGNFCLPLAWLLEVNGFEEGCDSVGGEDYILGLMLENRGRKIELDPAMHIEQDRRGLSHGHPLPRLDKGISPRDKSHAMNDRFRHRTHTEFTSDLRALRELAQAGKPLPIPDPSIDYRDWYDGAPIRDMRPLP
jgi:glycosyltransferase involved in cell wall biosynthesis